MLSRRSYYSLASLEGLNGGLSRKAREAPPGQASTPSVGERAPFRASRKSPTLIVLTVLTNVVRELVSSPSPKIQEAVNTPLAHPRGSWPSPHSFKELLVVPATLGHR